MTLQQARRPCFFGEKGISLIEIMFAVLILGLVVGPVLYSVSTMNRGSTASIYEAMAAQYADEILEQLRALPVNTIIEANRATSLSDFNTIIPIPLTLGTIGKLEFLPGVFLLVSEMPREIFQKRTLLLEKQTKTLEATTIHILKALVTVEWQVPGAPQVKRYSASTFLMEP